MVLSSQLNDIFLSLRQLKLPSQSVLGGVKGEGCKDTRRQTRQNQTPIYTAKEFNAWQYEGARSGSQIFVEFLRRITPDPPSDECVFTHGDVRTANIMVQIAEGNATVTGIIDWR
ncbi:MAG: hypothetical protein MMC23_006667 [Stictis urceolatum]|nr:hypothetical protein [Stictis urceolata]